jgi:DNA polymerase III epsilon subunit-like protein
MVMSDAKRELRKGTWVMVDVETDGPCPGDYSMLAIGAVIVEPGLGRVFLDYLKPISEKYQPEALAVNGITREKAMTFRSAVTVMLDFDEPWLPLQGNGQERDRELQALAPDQA